MKHNKTQSHVFKPCLNYVQFYLCLCFIYLFSLVYVLDLSSSSRSGKPHSFLENEMEKNRAVYTEGSWCDDS